MSNYFLSPTGDDNNSGTQVTPWKTFNKVGALIPGDTLHVRGGTHLNPYAHVGTPGRQDAPITIKAFENEVPLLTGNPTYNVFFNVFADWWNFEGLTIADTPVETSAQFSISNCNNISIKRLKCGKNLGSEQVRILNCSYVRIEDFDFSETGQPTDQGGGDNVYILGSHHILLRNGKMSKAGHASCDVKNSAENKSHHIIWDNLDIDQMWGGGLYSICGTQHTLCQNIRIKHTGVQVSYPKVGLQIAGEYGIWRRITITETGPGQDAITFAGYYFGGIVQNSRFNRVYNVTADKINRLGVLMVQRDDGLITDNKVLNSILYRVRTGGNTNPTYWPEGKYHIVADIYNSNVQWAAFPNNNSFQGCILGSTPGEPRLIYHQSREVADLAYSLAQAQSRFSPYFQGNLEADPKFVNADGGDYRLSDGSPAINAGVDLAKTTASGSSTILIPVDDPYSFFDGYGMIPGDEIRVGASVVRVKEVDHANKALVVDTPVSFSQGTPVNQNYSGTRPDIGAIEFGDPAIPAPVPVPTPVPTPTPTPTPQPVPSNKIVAWPKDKPKQNALLESMWKDRFRLRLFLMNIKGDQAEFERVS